MKTLITAALASAIATTSFADHYNHGRYNRYDNPGFEQEADWVRNQYKYKRMHARDYNHRQYHQQHQYHPQPQTSSSDVSLMLGIILGAIAANNN